MFTEIIKYVEQLKNRIKKILNSTKIIKSQRQPRKKILTSSTFEEHTTHGDIKCKNKKCGICNIIIEGKSYNFENPKTTFIINKNSRCNSKRIVYVIKCCKCKLYT